MFTKLKDIKLKKSEKRAIKLAIVVAIFVFLFNVVLYPLYQSFKHLKSEKIKYTRDLKVISKKIEEGKKMLKTVQALRKRYQRGLERLIQAENVELAQVFLEETITNYAKDRNLTIVRIYKERAKDEKGFKVVKARVTLKGDYSDIIDFLGDLEENPHYLYAESLVIRYYRGIEAVVSVKGIIKIKENGKSGGKK